MLKRIVTDPGVILFGVLYVAGLLTLSRQDSFPISEALTQLVLFGLIFPLLAWVATRKAAPLAVRGQRTDEPHSSEAAAREGRSQIEMVVLVAYILSLSIYLIHGPQLIDRLLPTAWDESPQIYFFVNAARKLVVFVAIPFLIFRAISGYRWRDYGVSVAALRELGRSHALVVVLVSTAFLLFQYFLGSAAAPVRGELSGQPLALGLILCFVWLAIEAGLVEEFFFRGLVQWRLSAWFKSEITAVALMSLIFGLAHAPGFIFRSSGEVEGLGSSPSVFSALAYAVVALAPSGILFGVVWARTRNLFAVIIIHAAGDLLPNVTRFVETWR